MTDDQASREAAFLEAQKAQTANRNWPRWWAFRIGGVVLVGAVVLGWHLWQSAQPDERSTAGYEKQITKWVDASTPGGGPITTGCPDPIEWRVGEEFHCVVHQGKQSLGVTVTMENDEGAATWRVSQ